MDARGGCAMKGDSRRRRRYNRQRDNQPANRGKREEMHQRTRGGGALISRGCGGGRVGREAEASTRQPAGKRETTMAMAKEKVTVMATENAAPPPSRDLVNAHLGPRD